MSKYTIHEITCPECNTLNKAAIWDSVNVSLDPELKDKVLKRELNRLICKKCGSMTPVDTAMLYHDMKRAYMIYYIPQHDEDYFEFEGELKDTMNSMNSYKFRLVTNDYNNLVEKIRILDAGLDDRAVEYLKMIVLHHAKDEVEGVYYDGHSDEYNGKKLPEAMLTFQVFGKEGVRMATLPFKEAYQDAMDMLKEAGKLEEQKCFKRYSIKDILKQLNNEGDFIN